MTEVGVPHWDFHNVVPDKTGEVKTDDVDWDRLKEQIAGRHAVVCLGGFVSRVVGILKSMGHPFEDSVLICIDHPSPRNRNFNDSEYEPKMIERLKTALKEAGIG